MSGLEGGGVSFMLLRLWMEVVKYEESQIGLGFLYEW